MIKKYVRLAGGLGDIMNWVYKFKDYENLYHLPNGTELYVLLQCHNPFSNELFVKEYLQHFNKYGVEMFFLNVGFRHTVEDIYKGAHNVFNKVVENRNEYSGEMINFSDNRVRENDLDDIVTKCLYYIPEIKRKGFDLSNVYVYRRSEVKLKEIIKSLGKYIVFNPSAGTPDRNIPESHWKFLVECYIKDGYKVVFIGRNYERHGHDDSYKIPEHENIYDFRDFLSVIDTMVLIRNAEALITPHTFTASVAGYEGTPQMIFYNDTVWNNHFSKKPRDEWSFFIDYPFNCIKHFKAEISRNDYLDFSKRINYRNR